MASEIMNGWVQRVLGVNPVVQAPAQARTGAGKVELTKRLLAIKDPANAAGLADRLLEVRDAVVASDPGAEALLVALERDVTKPAVETPRNGAHREPAVVGALAAIRLKARAVQGAQEAATITLQSACRRMLHTAAFEEDDSGDDPELKATIAAVGDRVPSFAPFSATIEAALAAMERVTDPAARAKGSGTIRSAITAYRKQVDAEPLLRAMENSEAGTFAIHSAIAGALNELDSALA